MGSKKECTALMLREPKVKMRRPSPKEISKWRAKKVALSSPFGWPLPLKSFQEDVIEGLNIDSGLMVGAMAYMLSELRQKDDKTSELFQSVALGMATQWMGQRGFGLGLQKDDEEVGYTDGI